MNSWFNILPVLTHPMQNDCREDRRVFETARLYKLEDVSERKPDTRKEFQDQPHRCKVKFTQKN